MRSEYPEICEIAEYVAAMLDELAELSKPLQDVKLTSVLSVSADLARAHHSAADFKAHDVMLQETEAEDTEPRGVPWDHILPARHKSHPRAPAKSKRLSRAMQ